MTNHTPSCCPTCRTELLNKKTGSYWYKCKDSSCLCHQQSIEPTTLTRENMPTLVRAAQKKYERPQPPTAPKSDGELDKWIEECIGVFGNKAYQGSYAAPREAFRKILLCALHTREQAMVQAVKDAVRGMPMRDFLTIEEDKLHGVTASFNVRKFEGWLLSQITSKEV